MSLSQTHPVSWRVSPLKGCDRVEALVGFHDLLHASAVALCSQTVEITLGPLLDAVPDPGSISVTERYGEGWAGAKHDEEHAY
ncbi:hypothetical protein [Methylobacterium iners]|uniref:hypothetical protein n=1 Tax=Methylobacterium iners TaxID=418707 RepID=UPI001EE27E5B|nr:hypothetical protein [Methylobacterium iners]